MNLSAFENRLEPTSHHASDHEPSYRNVWQRCYLYPLCRLLVTELTEVA